MYSSAKARQTIIFPEQNINTVPNNIPLISKRMGNWAEMIPELLTIIVDNLHLFQDFAAFRGVCTLWRKVATKESYSKRSCPQPPLLMLAEKDEDKHTGCRDFYCPATKKVHRRLLPEASGKWCLETLGWLVMVDTITQEMELFHPLSKARAALPHKSTFHHSSGDDYYNIIKKAVLSTSPSFTQNYLLIVIYSLRRHLAFWRPGSPTWNHIETTTTYFDDVIFYKDNQFLAINSDGSVYVIEFDLDGSIRMVKFIVSPNPSLFRGSEFYLVMSKDVLLIVYRMRFIDRKSKKFGVYESDISLSLFKENRDLGSRVLFLGNNASYSYSVDTCKFPVIKPNCIYYSDDYFGFYMGRARRLSLEFGGEEDMGLYSLGDGKREDFFEDESLSFTCPSIWVTPSF